MIYHYSCDLPVPVSTTLNHEVPDLTQEEVRIIKKQIRRNTELVDQFVSRLELFVNKERYPKDAVFLEKIRRRLELIMEENDTFRKVLWSHYQKEEVLRQTNRNVA